MVNTMLTNAMSYVRKGIPVFPCRPQSKTPATSTGFKDATTNFEQVRAWWSKNPRYNIGIPTGKASGFWILDVDGEEGYESLKEFEDEIPHDTPRVITGSDGLHLYFRYDETTSELNNSVKRLPGLDVRAEGGYVLAPESVHPNGEAYQHDGVHRKPATAPAKLFEALQQTPQESPRVNTEDSIPQGQRNDTLFRNARSLFARGYGEPEVFSLLGTFNQNRCVPPVSDRELRDIITSAARYGRGQIHTENPEQPEENMQSKSGNENPLLQSRIFLADAIRHGSPEPDVFEPDILLTGKRHHFFAKGGQAKTWLALYLTMRAIERGQKVLYLDTENGSRIVQSRFAQMGIETEGLDERLHYLYLPNLDAKHESRRNYEDLLDTMKPNLIVFDSLINFLSKCGYEENSNSNISQWSTYFLQPPVKREITIVILDHVPHDGTRARGGSKKFDEMDVQWKVEIASSFDRENVGTMKLTREKDRESWLPETLTFELGGTPFVFNKTNISSSSEDPKRTTSAQREKQERQNKIYNALANDFPKGARAGQLIAATGIKEATFYRDVKTIPESYVEKRDGLYVAILQDSHDSLNQSHTSEDEGDDSDGRIHYLRPIRPSDFDSWTASRASISK